ncbi:cystathionine gamma-synthase [Pasteurellaceae bacterium Macca]|nr:cystathionine gamma-synthase [Pasteurellaceae bacterium Macca]
MKKAWLLATLLAPTLWATTIEIQQFDNPQQEADYNTLIQALRCPQCQNNNIADSNATIATDMRHKTLELLKQGKNKEDVVNYMVERYGNFVTYDPPLTPATILLWLMPLLLVLLGGSWVLLGRKTAKQGVDFQQQSAHASTNDLDEQRLKQILNGEKE